MALVGIELETLVSECKDFVVELLDYYGYVEVIKYKYIAQ